MRNILINLLLLVCACINTHAQTNFVKNPGFENFSQCPEGLDELTYARFWRGALDSNYLGEAEYYNACGNIFLDHRSHIPDNTGFFQYPHTGNGLAGAHFYYDKSTPSPPSHLPFDYRDYIQGHLMKKLDAGRIYCVSYWINMAEAAGYGTDKMGAYLDDGSINDLSLPVGSEITSVTPQIYTNDIIIDTANWVKIEGSFTATGNEDHITVGLFFTNAATSKVKTNYWFSFKQLSYYLIDDVSVIPIDLAADAGKDSHAELGKKVQIGRVGDTTAQGLDCKWYKKGVLIDSGAIINVDAGASVGAIDTYVVVQTICGLVKTDTVMVKTVPVGFREYGTELEFSVYPNPSNGVLTITTPHAVIPQGSLHAKVYDLLGRVVYQKELSFTDNQASVDLSVADGIYILEFIDAEGNASRQRIEIRN